MVALKLKAGRHVTLDDAINWLNDNSGAVQAVAVLVLAVVTFFYMLSTGKIARSTEEEAKSTKEVVEETRRTRMDDARPVLALRWILQEEFGTGHLAMSEALSEAWNDTHLSCGLVNIGRGPALNIEAKVVNPQAQVVVHSMGTLMNGADHDDHFRFAVQDGLILVRYQDVFGRWFYRPVAFDTGGSRVGSLEVGLEGEPT